MGFYFKARKVGDVIEGHLFYVEDESSLVRDFSEGAFAAALQLSDLDLSAIALRFILIPLVEGDRVGVLVATIFCQLV